MSIPERPHAQAKTIHLFAYVQPTDPGMIGAKKGWVDTSGSPAILKVRNNTNTGWFVVGASGGGGGGEVDPDEVLDLVADFIVEGTGIDVTRLAGPDRLVISAVGVAAHSIGDHTDVHIVDPHDGDILVYNSGLWRNIHGVIDPTLLYWDGDVLEWDGEELHWG